MERKEIKLMVYTDHYNKLKTLAYLHNRKIWEELDVALQQYLEQFSIEVVTTTTTESESESEIVAKYKPNTSLNLTTSQRAKIWLDSMNIPPEDISMATYDKLCESLSNVLGRIVKNTAEFNVEIFDEIQFERRNNE